MKTVLRMLASVVGITFEMITVVGRAVGLGQPVVVPCATEVILAACSVHVRRPFLTVYEEHIVTFTPPTRLIGIQVQTATNVMTFSLDV